MTVLDPPISTLSAAMRDGSRLEHQEAEDSLFMSELLAGRVNETGYADYLLRLRGVYEAMERAVRRHAADPVVAAVHDSALERLDALDADLAHWAPGRGTQVVSPATDAYRERLGRAGEWGGLLVAHHYTRYLGDLSGGQYLGPAIARSYGLNGDGHRFFVFDGVRPPAFRTRYREMLDAIRWSPAEEATFLAEVSEAYRLNIEVLAQLKERWTA